MPKFNHIEHYVLDGELIIIASCNEDASLQAEERVKKCTLIEMFGDEFMTSRRKQKNGSPPEWIPDGGECSLDFWHENYMSKSKAWQIFEAVSIDELTFNTSE